ncbi:hypothetical protein KAR91_67715 [Candidatus Pacearchaeota archaeon]|nr:hypothetical protein [Candidatus Pacearchaeota archaeon]
MATQIFLSGGAVNITGDNFVNTQIINPAHFDFKKTNANYFARDGIENQSYDLGAVGDVEDENGIAYASEVILVSVLNGFVNHGTDMAAGVVPTDYTLQTSSVLEKNIQKGQLNKIRVRPAILNEQAESSREIQGVVDASTIVGQILKASQDNINGILLTLESAEGEALDNFESYADSAALQLVWVKGGTNEATLEETIVESGTKSMELPGTVLDDDWVDTISSKDYTDYTFEFDFQQSNLIGQLKYEFTLSDGTDTLSFLIVPDVINDWQHIEVDINAMTDSATTDKTAITKIGFRVIDTHPLGVGYVDNLIATPPPGSIGLKLWDMGDTIPETAVTSIDDGTQYVELGDKGNNGGSVVSEIILPLEGGKRLYSINNFIAGVALEIPSNTLLTPDNYYIITLNYIDTDVSVYGPDSSFSIQYYNNGYAFTAPDEATAITAIGEFNNCMFGILSTQDVFVNTLLKFYDSAPGSLARESVFVEDKNMVITGIVLNDILAQIFQEFEFKDRVFPMPKGSKFEIYYNDDFSDSVSLSTLLIGYMYKPPIING